MHAVLVCRALAYERAAEAAGKSLGGDAVATEASTHMQHLLASTDIRIKEQCGAIPRIFHPGLGLSASNDGASCIPGLFERWLYSQAAILLGHTFASLWSKTSQHVQPALLPSCSFSLDDDIFRHELHEHVDMSKLARGEPPLFTAWWSFAWEAVL